MPTAFSPMGRPESPHKKKKKKESSLIRSKEKLIRMFTKILEHWIGFD